MGGRFILGQFSFMFIHTVDWDYSVAANNTTLRTHKRWLSSKISLKSQRSLVIVAGMEKRNDHAEPTQSIGGKSSLKGRR